MMQFFKDLLLRLRSDRKTQLITFVAVAGVLFFMFGQSAPKPRPQQKKPAPQQASTNTNADERWKDLIEGFSTQINQLTTQSASLREDLNTQKKAMAEYEATTAEIFKKILERLTEVQNNASTAPVASKPQSIGDITAPELIGAAPVEMEILGSNDVPAQPPVQPIKPKLAAIMPGDSVRIKLLAGVNAPTDGTPYPVVLKLVSNVIGPDGNTIPLGEARVIAAAQGSLTDARVLFRLTRLSIRLPDGKRKEFPVDGWIVGEDGIRGMEGVLIDPLGKAIVGAGMAGGLSGLGQGIAAANTQNRVYGNGTTTSQVDSSNIPAFAAGVGLSGAANEWSDIIKDRLAQMVPVVQVLSGREATAVFSQSVAIPELLDQLDSEDPGVVFTSLD